MKKNLEKIFASASIIIAIIMIMILIVTAFGGIEFKEFENELVRGLLITLAILYFVLAGVALVMMFVNSDVIKDVVIRTETGGSVRVSASVITKMVKRACAEIEGLKCKKVVLVQTDYGVRLKLNVKIVDKDVVETETYLRTLLEDMFFGEFGFKFESIEVKIMVLTPKYKSDKSKIDAIVADKVATIRAEQSENAPEVASAETEVKADIAAANAQTVAKQAEAVTEQTGSVSAQTETAKASAAEVRAEQVSQPTAVTEAEAIAEPVDAPEQNGDGGIDGTIYL